MAKTPIALEDNSNIIKSMLVYLGCCSRREQCLLSYYAQEWSVVSQKLQEMHDSNKKLDSARLHNYLSDNWIRRKEQVPQSPSSLPLNRSCNPRQMPRNGRSCLIYEHKGAAILVSKLQECHLTGDYNIRCNISRNLTLSYLWGIFRTSTRLNHQSKADAWIKMTTSVCETNKVTCPANWGQDVPLCIQHLHSRFERANPWKD